MGLRINRSIHNNEVHICSVRLIDYEDFIIYFASILSTKERQQVNKFMIVKDKKRFIITRGLLRCILSLYLRCPPQSIEISYRQWGKPFLSPKEHLFFNLSHCNEYALYAFTASYEVGIDIEYIDPKIELEELDLDIFLSPAEKQYWNLLDTENRLEFFFKLWTCTEAFLKAIGKGFSSNKREIIFRRSALYRQTIQADSPKNKVFYPYHFKCIEGYISSLYVMGPPLYPIYWTWEKEYMETLGQLREWQRLER